MRQTDWDETFDVVVVGAGFAGLTAAIEAFNAGASVVVLEKMRAVGGNSIISDGGVSAPCTNLQEMRGIVDSPELMAADMLKAGLGLNQVDLVQELVQHANEVFDWSKDYLEIPYEDRVDQFGGHSVPRCYTALNKTGATIIKKLVEKVNSLGIPIRTGVHFETFVQNPLGEIEGLVVNVNYQTNHVHEGVLSHIKVNKGVILASGGFGADVAFRSQQDARLDEQIDTTNKPFATAETLKEAIRIGADTVDLSCIQLGPWASPDEKGYGDGPEFSEYIVFQYGLVVDPQTGRRFINELTDRKDFSDKLLSIGHPCIGIADEKCVQLAGWNIDKCLKKGVVKPFQTLHELADFYQIDVDSLKQTMLYYNDSVHEMNDREYGKLLQKNAVPLETPPFYGIRLWPKVHHTMGGLRIDTDTRVLDKRGIAIPKLFAAGEVTGGVHGASRLGSCAITECFVFGRIAGKNAVRLL